MSELAMKINKGPFRPNPSEGLELPGRSLYREYGKRLFDVVCVILALPLVLPLLAALVLAVRISGGPAFYYQERLGRDGRIFRCWKLRTMVADAEQVLERRLTEDDQIRSEWSQYQKLSNDPRITPLGRFLRKNSLDELPQLWNVLCGDMSLVGPRPMTPHQFQFYPGTAYLHLRPGITGTWQVSERHQSAFVERARYDEEYFRELSFRTDVRIILATIPAVLDGTGQ